MMREFEFIYKICDYQNLHVITTFFTQEQNKNSKEAGP